MSSVLDAVRGKNYGLDVPSVRDRVSPAEWEARVNPEVRRPFGVLERPAPLRKLDRTDPTYRD